MKLGVWGQTPELICLEDRVLIDIMVQNKKTGDKKKKERKEEGRGRGGGQRENKFQSEGEKTQAAAFVFL